MVTTVTILGITTAVLAIAAGYFAFKHNKVNDQFMDQKVKFESVIAYSKGLEEKLQSTKAKATKTEETVKAGKPVKMTEAPKRRGRKPSAK